MDNKLRDVSIYPWFDVALFECPDCDGLGGHACLYCPDEKVCLHYIMCETCQGTGEGTQEVH